MTHVLPEYTNPKRPGRALLVEGGGMRGAFPGGVLSVMAQRYPVENFDLVVGVSSGSCSAAYYVTSTGSTRAESAKFLMVWRHELTHSKLISIKNVFKGKAPLDQEYLVDELFGERYRIERERLFEKERTPFYIAVSNLETIQPEFIRATGDNLLPLLKAATSLPIATRGKRRLGRNVYTDGGVLDPLPIKKIIEAGYTDITVILTNPRDYVEKPTSWLVSKLCFPRNPVMARLLHERQHLKHREGYHLLKNPPEGVRMTIIDPPAKLPVSMIGSHPLHLNDSVDLGIARAMEIYGGGQPRQKGWKERLGEWLPGWLRGASRSQAG